MQTQLNISKPQLIDDPLTFQKPMHNRFGRFTFAEKFRNLIQAIIQLFKTIFCSSKRKYDSIKIEMISTGTSKLENRVKPIWADDEVGLKDTLKSGDILFVMGAGIDPRITYGQLISQTWSGAVPVTDSNRYTEHPCMYVKDENGEEWIVENAPEVTVNEGKKSRKILGEGSIKVSFKEHPLFLQLKDKDHKESKFNKKNGSDLFIKVVRPTDPKLAQEAAKVALIWSSMTTSKGDPTSKIGKAEDSYVQKYSFLSAGASILISASDNATTKKKFLKWAFLSQYPINKGEKKLPGTFCSSYITWILRVAESKKILQDLCNQEGEDRALNQFVDLMEHPNSVEAFDLKNDPKRLNILIDQIYQKHRETIIKTATVQLYPEGATPGRLLDYMKANPAAFKQIASIIPRNHAALAKSIG